MFLMPVYSRGVFNIKGNFMSTVKEKFSELLLHDNWKIRCQVAHHMLEVMNYPEEYRKMALDEIKGIKEKGVLLNG